MKGKLLFGIVALGAAAYCAYKAFVPEEKKEEEEITFVELDDEDEPVVNNVKKLYPYLDDAFVESILAKEEELNVDGDKVTVKHQCSFPSEEALNTFKAIAADLGYTVDGDELEVTVANTFDNAEGRVMSDIFNVANQVACLNGEYKGYICA
ncbi:MAG: hypothetical protein HUJ57_02935 [Erysipelotrichaceae bacterium]|nr:hypothetical protein [Erysipelotrichaceae bacterium]